MKKNIIITFGVVIILCLVGYYMYIKNHNFVNQPVENIGQCDNLDLQVSKDLVQAIESDIDSYATSSKDIIDKSSQGGMQVDYLLNGKVVLVKQTFYGETGKSEVVYYFQKEKVFYINKKNTEYVLSLFEDPSGKIKSVEIKDFYLDSSQDLCFWYKNQELKPNDQDSRDLVQFLISGL